MPKKKKKDFKQQQISANKKDSFGLFSGKFKSQVFDNRNKPRNKNVKNTEDLE